MHFCRRWLCQSVVFTLWEVAIFNILCDFFWNCPTPKRHVAGSTRGHITATTRRRTPSLFFQGIQLLYYEMYHKLRRIEALLTCKERERKGVCSEIYIPSWHEFCPKTTFCHSPFWSGVPSPCLIGRLWSQIRHRVALHSLRNLTMAIPISYEIGIAISLAKPPSFHW